MQGRLGRFMLGVGAFELGNAAATLLILRATELLTPGHGHHRAIQLALLLYTGYNAAAAVVSVPGGRIIDRRSAALVLTLGVIAFGIAYLGLALTGAAVTLLLVFFVAAGIGIGFVETAQHAAVAALASADVRGSAFGLPAAVQSFGNLAASAVAGALWTFASPRVAFLYLSAWMCVAAFALRRGGGRPDGA